RYISKSHRTEKRYDRDRHYDYSRNIAVMPISLQKKADPAHTPLPAVAGYSVFYSPYKYRLLQ
ncbi:MAG TPA: hypothetical protein VGO58_10805, partial [Chitinophagaceae bacterium]|nr:hypothetical protein [Chitinophagaceae bacterium]